MRKNRQLDLLLYKSQDRFRHSHPSWRQYEKVLSDLGLDKRQVQIAEHAALQVGLVEKNRAPGRKFIGIDKNDVGLDGDITLPMPGGNGRFLLPKSPFRLMQRAAKRAEAGYLRRMGLIRHLETWIRIRK